MFVMNVLQGRRRPRSALGFAFGAVLGGTVLALANVVGAHSTAVQAIPEQGLRDVLHRPRLFAAPGAIAGLRYEAVCQADSFGKPCALAGHVFYRSAGASGYQRQELRDEGNSALSVSVSLPKSGGLSYYAVISDATGRSITVPAGGSAAPQRIWAIPATTAIDLGTHEFGRTRTPDSRRLAAAWGSGRAALGLLSGREQVAIGPSAFAVSRDGSITVLDQVNDRLAIYGAKGAPPRHVPVAIAGGEGDLALGDDGTRYVLDQGAVPVVRAYTASGALASTARIAGRGADMLRVGRSAAFVHAVTDEMWLPVAEAGEPVDPSVQRVSAQPGRSVGDGSQVIVDAGPDDAAFALVRGEHVTRAWTVTSGTTIGEVQLAEPYGDGLLVVLRVWTATDAEFVALVLGRAGLVRTFSMAPAEWAESAPLGRFHLSGSLLYQIRSAPTGVEIVTFDLGGGAR